MKSQIPQTSSCASREAVLSWLRETDRNVAEAKQVLAQCTRRHSVQPRDDTRHLLDITTPKAPVNARNRLLTLQSYYINLQRQKPRTHRPLPITNMDNVTTQNTPSNKRNQSVNLQRAKFVILAPQTEKTLQKENRRENKKPRSRNTKTANLGPKTNTTISTTIPDRHFTLCNHSTLENL